MRLPILSLVVLSGLLLTLTPPAQAAKRSRAAAKAADSGSEEIPPITWKLASSGFVQVFRMRNAEIESTEPGRFFPASVAFALGRIDDSGHFLMLKCHSAADNCSGKRDELEDRIVYATLLQVVRTKAPKELLFDQRTWELTPLGYEYLEKLRKRHKDLSTRLAKLIGTALADRPRPRAH